MESPSPPLTKKRKQVPHTKIASEKIANSLPVKVAEEIYQSLLKNSVLSSSNTCVFPKIKTRNGDYPRLKLNQDILRKIQDANIRKLALDATKVRIPYHVIAWRATGNLVPEFSSGIDISHKCRRGQMRKPNVTNKNSTFHCHEEEFGCFSMQCLELSSHQDNLSRGTCSSIMQCPHCQLLFNSCKHDPTCGSATMHFNEALKNQKEVKSIQIEFVDGTKIKLSLEHNDRVVNSTN